MIRPIEEKPDLPKNGDRWKPKDKPTQVFRYGRWVPLIEEEDE